MDRIIRAGIAFADREGLDALSMRRLGDEIGADPMAVYHHVSDKRTMLALMADSVVSDIEPITIGEWSSALTGTILRARRTMLEHPWAVQVLTREDAPGAATLAYLDAIFGILRGGGLSVALTHHAIHLFGSRVLGFSQDLFDDRSPTPPSAQEQGALADAWQATLPHVAEMARAAAHDGGLGGCDDDLEFEFALQVIIEGLERRA